MFDCKGGEMARQAMGEADRVERLRILDGARRALRKQRLHRAQSIRVATVTLGYFIAPGVVRRRSTHCEHAPDRVEVATLTILSATCRARAARRSRNGAPGALARSSCEGAGLVCVFV